MELLGTLSEDEWYEDLLDEFFKLLTGSNTVRLTATSGTSACTVKWYDRFVSLHA